MNLQQTSELIAGILALKLRHDRNLADDGKESPFEKLGYAFELRAIKKAIEGIRLIPFELADLTPDEVPELAQAVSIVLNAWGVNHRRQDITSEIIKTIVESIPAFRNAIECWDRINAMPPTAIAVTN